MKTLLEIIEEVKDGGRPDYDDLRYALLMMDYLEMTFFNHMSMNLYGKGKLDKFDIRMFESHYRERQRFLNSPPKESIGSFDPDAPGRQQERAAHKRFAEKFFPADAEKGESHA